MKPRAGGTTGVALALIAAALVGCSSPEDRAAKHRRRAEDMLAESEGLHSIREAGIELRNAVALDPSNPDSNMLLGRTLLRMGVVDEAIAYLEEAHALAPTRSDIAVDLARALLFADPTRAAALASKAQENEADRFYALLVVAEAQAALGDYDLALARLIEAERTAPGNADIEWSRARVYEAKIRTLRLRPGRTMFDSRDFESIVAAYDAYVAKGGERPATVLLSKAKLLSIWPGHADEAVQSYLEAADLARDTDPMLAILALEGLAGYARATGDVDQRLVALERLVELDPERVDHWEEWVRLAAATDRPTQPILEAMLGEVGDDPRAHVVYARSLRDELGLAAAVEHLRSRIDATDDDALLLAQLVQLQTQGGRPLDGDRTLAELVQKYPEDVQTRLLLARRAMRGQEPEAALEAIAAIAHETGHREALRLWARATEVTGDREAALAIVERIIAEQSEFEASVQAWKADLLYQLGRPDEALAALQRLDWADELTPTQTLLQARCEYDLGRRVAGRQRLANLLEEPNPPIEAVLEFYRREGDHPPSRPMARQALIEAHARAPGRIDVFEALVDLDVALGQPGMGTQRITLALAQRPKDPRLYALRARVRLSTGHPKGARIDAERALILNPGHGDEALAVLLAISEMPNQQARALEIFEAQAALGDLSLHRKVVLGRLMARSGRLDEGLVLLEEALAEGAEFTVLKSDVARLLVSQGGDLDRAEALAKQAVEVDGEQVAAADTLGLVYLAKELFDAAMWQFRFAADRAEPPNADYFLHLGQALEGMNRGEAARDAYARALEIDPDHAYSRAALSALGDANAPPHTDPS